MVFPAWWMQAASAMDGQGLVQAPTTLGERLVSLFGVFAFVGLAWLLRERDRKVDWRPVVWGTVFQFAAALIILSPTVSHFFYTVMDSGVNRLLAFTEDGANFLFGTIEPHEIVVDGAPHTYAGVVSPPMKSFAFWILPTIVFFSALMSVMYYLGIMQLIVRVMARVMVKTFGTSGAESLSTAANIFVGQTEAPLLVRPFVASMTRSELMCVMVGGFGTVAGGVMGAYVKFLHGIPGIAGHLMIASIIAAPATIAISKVMVPETEVPKTRGEVSIEMPKPASNVIEAAALGATDGMSLAINVGAMLIAFVALVKMVDFSIGAVPVVFCGDTATLGYTCAAGAHAAPLDLAHIFGWVFFPLAFLMGVPLHECAAVGQLLGEKVVLTEFVAFFHLGQIVDGATPLVLSQRTSVIASYALCGFSNFASIGIQLGGIGAMAPERRGELASLGLKAMVAGMLVNCMTAAVVGVLL